MKNNIALRPVYLASVSGGKDSLFMLYLILKNPEKYPLDGVVHYELEIDYPFVTNVINKMKEMCKEMAYQMLKFPEESKTFWNYIFKEWNENKLNCLRGDSYTPDYIYNRVKNYWLPKVKEILEKG